MRYRLLLLVGCVSTLLFSCFGSDVGAPCELPKDAQQQVKELGEKAKVVVPSFQCVFSYCFATYYDEKNPTKGYCSKVCEKAEDCPSSEQYTCTAVIQLDQELPPEYRQSLASLIGKKICKKKGP